MRHATRGPKGLWIAMLLLAGGEAFAVPEPAVPPAGAGHPAAPSGWIASVTQTIQRSEYRFSAQPDGSFVAPNRAWNLRARLDAEGLTVTPRVGPEEAPAFTLGMRLSRYGREGALFDSRADMPRLEGERVAYWREGLDEWYVNDERGIEQGFTLREPPDGTSSTLPVVLELEARGDLSAFPSEDGRAMSFATAAGVTVLRYGELRVTDARDADVPARLAVRSGRLCVLIDDRDALYPLEIDPLFTSPAWTTEGNQANANYGSALSVVGDVNGDGYSDILVGAELFDSGQADEGKVFLYHGSASGPSTSPAWTAESNQAGAQFGIRVAPAGDVNGDGYDDVLVGAQYYDNGQTDEGSVFLWLGGPSGLGPNGTPANADWTAESNQANSWMCCPAPAGDVNGDGYDDVLVGAYHYSNPFQAGAAFLWYGSASGMGSAGNPGNADWTAQVGGAGSELGYSLGTAGDVNGDGYDDVIIGARGWWDTDIAEGAAFAWYGGEGGLGPNGTAGNADWKFDSNREFDSLGHGVSTAGDVDGDGYADVLVGDLFYDNGQEDEGQALLFRGSSAGLSSVPAWTAEPDVAGAKFGGFVSTAGDVNGDGYADVLIGAPNYANGQFDEGGAFVWYGGPTGLGANGTPGNADWHTEGDQGSVYLGAGIGAAGDVNGDGYSDILVGAPTYTADQAGEGRAYLYLGSGGGPVQSPGRTLTGTFGIEFGISVASAGDVNGDGYDDVIVGDDKDSPDELFPVGHGRVYVYLGSANGPATSAAWQAAGNGDYFGRSVASAGDVNGDGYADVIVGAPGGPGIDGHAFVWYGSPSGLGPSGTLANADWSAAGNQSGAELGFSVATAGDVNGDGFADVIVGARRYSNGQTREGRAYVYLGSASGLATTPAWSAESDQGFAEFGYSVASAGDVNGDGYSDVIVGAHLYDTTGLGDNGKVYVYLGSSSGLGTTAAWTAAQTTDNVEFGSSVASAGDVNGDGYSDIVVGAPQEDAAYVWYGGSPGNNPSGLGENGTNSNMDWFSHGDPPFPVRFGASVASAGDVNGDGYSDLIVGAEGRLVYCNSATLYLGSASGLPAQAAWTVIGLGCSPSYAWSVASAGDVNGDGFADPIVGAFKDSIPHADLYYGNALPGLDRAARQVRADGTAPIGLLGRSDSEAAFRLRALGRSPAGRDRVRLEWEVKPMGTPFDGTAPGHGPAFVDTGFPELATGSATGLEAIVSGLAASTGQRWRARIASRDPFFPRSPWLTPAGNNRTEMDFRTPASAAPFVVDVTPPDQSEGQSLATNVVVTFSEAVNGGTITSSTFRLKDPGGVPVSAAVSLSGSGRQAVLDPASALLPETLYTVEVTSGVLDLAANPATPFTSSFRSGAAGASSGTPLPSVSDPSAPPPSPASGRLGSAVSAAGDLNGDGTPDFVAGSPGYVVGGSAEAGAAVVYLGSGVPAQRQAPDIIFTGVGAHDRAGVSVSGDFDFNGDGTPDLLIGAEQVDRTGAPTPVGSGKVYLLYFDPTDATHYPNIANPNCSDTVSLSLVGQPGGIPGVVFTGVGSGDQAGFSVAGRGAPGDPCFPTDPCLPGDPCRAYAAILIGTPGSTPPNPIRPGAGTVYEIYPPNPIISGTVSLSRVANGLGNEIPGIVYRGAEAEDHLGFAVTFPGDIVGSPGTDIAFSSPYADTFVDATTFVDAGTVYVARGGEPPGAILEADAIGSTIAGTQLLGEQAGALLGFSIAGGGDSQVDGAADFLMGAPLYDVEAVGFSALTSALTDAGVVYQTSSKLPGGIIEVCRVGSMTESDPLPGILWTGVVAGDQLGYSVAGVGDVNGDALADIALGAPYSDPTGTTNAGSTYLIDGAACSTAIRGTVSVSTVGTTTSGATLVGTQTGELSGSALAGVDDINGAGTADMAVGAPNRDLTPGDDAGTVYQVVLDDADGDGFRDGVDCAKNDAAVWALPAEARGDALSYIKPKGLTIITWSEPLERGGLPSSLRYDTLRSTSPSNFTTAAICLETAGVDTTSTDTATPTAGSAFFYLVRAKNTCGAGTAGSTSSGSTRIVRSCP